MRVAVVLAGGLGTRVRNLTRADCPKVLLPIDGRPFIDFKLAQLAKSGVDRVLLLVGRGAHAVQAHVGNGSEFGLDVRYHRDGPTLLGTGGAVQAVLPDLPQRFWITYGDALVDAPLSEVEACVSPPLVGSMTVLKNCDRWEPSNVDVAEGLVTRYEKGLRPGSLTWIDYGLLYLDRAAFTYEARDTPFDLSAVVQDAVQRRRLAAFPVDQRFHDIGTEEAWRATDEWARSTRLWERLTPGRDVA